MQKFFWCAVLFFSVCTIVSGSFLPVNLIAAAIIGITAAAVTIFVFRFSIPIEFHPIRTMYFLVVLFKSIYTNTFVTLFTFMRSGAKIQTELHEVPLKTKKSLSRLLICQGITLTPGTVSVNSTAGVVSVLQFTGDSLNTVHEFDTILGEK